MRAQRLLVSFIAACLLGLVPVATATASHASEPAAERTTATPVKQATATADRTRRNITFNFDATSRRSFRFFGKVQDAAGKRIILVRSNTRNGTFRHFRQAKTNRQSRYNITGLRRVGFYALKVPGGNKYLTSYSKVIRVYYS